MQNDDPRALTDVDVARRLGISTHTLKVWRFRGGGPTFRRFGRSVRYLREDVERFVEASAIRADVAGRRHQSSQQ